MIGGISHSTTPYLPTNGRSAAFVRDPKELQQPAAVKDSEVVQIDARQLQSEETGADTKQQKPVRSQPSSELTPDELKQIQELRVRDREVRAHELAHKSVAGRYAVGGANYAYQAGPDGQRYAVGGDVQIDTSSVPGDARATLEKAQQLIQAALAPAQPSATDRQVAAELGRMVNAARQMLLGQTQEGDKPKNSDETTETSGNDSLRVTRVPSRLHSDRQIEPPGIAAMREIQSMTPGGELLTRGGRLDLFA